MNVGYEVAELACPMVTGQLRGRYVTVSRGFEDELSCFSNTGLEL